MKYNIKNDLHFPHYSKPKIEVVNAPIGCWVVNLHQRNSFYMVELASFVTRKEARDYARQIRYALRGN